MQYYLKIFTFLLVFVSQTSSCKKKDNEPDESSLETTVSTSQLSQLINVENGEQALLTGNRVSFSGTCESDLITLKLLVDSATVEEQNCPVGSWQLYTYLGQGAHTVKIVAESGSNKFERQTEVNVQMMSAPLKAVCRASCTKVNTPQLVPISENRYFISIGYSGTVDVQIGETTYQLESSGTEDFRLFITDESFNILSQESFSTNDAFLGSEVSYDSVTGDIYFSLRSSGTVTYQKNNVTEIAVFPASPNYGHSIFKLNSSLSVQWYSEFVPQGANKFSVGSLVYNDGKVWFAGWFSGILDIEPGAGSQNIIGVLTDSVIISLDSADGSNLSHKVWSGDHNDSIRDLLVSQSGDIYVVGGTRSTDSDLGSGSAKHASAGTLDPIVVRYDSDLNYVLHKASSTSSEGGYSDIVELSEGELIVFGYQKGMSAENLNWDNLTENYTSVGGDSLYYLKFSNDLSSVDWVNFFPNTTDSFVGTERMVQINQGQVVSTFEYEGSVEIDGKTFGGSGRLSRGMSINLQNGSLSSSFGYASPSASINQFKNLFYDQGRKQLTGIGRSDVEIDIDFSNSGSELLSPDLGKQVVFGFIIYE